MDPIVPVVDSGFSPPPFQMEIQPVGRRRRLFYPKSSSGLQF